jgi:5-formyltetrahydrofolate cyclo-ligase
MNRPEVMAWRRQTRAALLAARQALPIATYRQAGRAILERLMAHFLPLHTKLVGFYWPFQREFNALPFVEEILAEGGSAALPVVVEKRQPLQFRLWHPGIEMAVGVYDIPVPAKGEPVRPEALLVPMVGFDEAGYRLGYGGGYYDRTLATYEQRPLTIGIAFDLGRLPTIHPLPHDMTMDYIITEKALLRREGSRLAPVP